MISVDVLKCKKGRVYLTGNSYGMLICLCLGQKFDEETYDKPQYVTMFAEMPTGRVYQATGGMYAGYLTTLEKSEFETFINKWEIVNEIS